MTWRFFAIASFLVVGLIMNGWFLFQEDIQPPEKTADIVNEVRTDPLKQIEYTANTRFKNLKKFGLPEDLAEAASREASRVLDARGLYLLDLMKEDRNLFGPILCPGGFTQRYGAAELLISESNGKREVVSLKDVHRLQSEPWWQTALVEQLYEKLEFEPGRHENATVMGIGAVLLSREGDAIDERKPWGGGLVGSGWNFDDMLSENPGLKKKLVNYFASMHLLTEIANGEGGICK